MDELIAEAKDFFDKASRAEQDNRDAALNDIRFARLSDQWPEDVRRDRELQGRPCLTINRLPSFIRQVVNDCRQNRPAISVSGVDSESDVETAEMLTGLIRNIEYMSNASAAYDTAVDAAISGGFGYFRVNIDYAYDDTFDLDIKIDAITNQFSVYGDPDSKCSDSSDWNKCIIVDLIDKKEFKKKYKDKKESDFDSDAYDRLDSPWKVDDKIQIAEYWVREETQRSMYRLNTGEIVDEDTLEMLSAAQIPAVVLEERAVRSHKVTQYIISGVEVLETNEWPGRYIPIIPVYGEEVHIEGVRHLKSLVRDSIDAQRNFNYWKTTSTELVALAPRAPWIGPEEAFTGVDSRKWAVANVSNHAYLAYKGQVPPQRQPFAGVPAGALQEAMNSSEDIQSTMGMFGASIGMQDNAISGKAIVARQRESDTGTFHFVDNLSRAIRHAGCIIVDLIPKIYTPGRIVRVLGEDGNEEGSIPIGQPTQMENGVMKIYDPSIGKYDVTVKSGPSFNTKREEAATQIIELMRVYPQGAQLITDILAENLDWPGAQEIAKRFKAMLPPQLQGDEQQQMQQLQQQAQQAMQQQAQQAQQAMQQMQAEIEKLKTDKSIDAEEVRIKAYDAETKRLQATQSGMTAEQIQVLIMQTMQQLLTTPDVTPIQPIQQPPEL